MGTLVPDSRIGRQPTNLGVGLRQIPSVCPSLSSDRLKGLPSGNDVLGVDSTRHEPRTPVDVDILLESDDGVFLERYEIVDLSSSGMCVRGRRRLPVGQTLSLMLSIEGREVQATGEVVWKDEPDPLPDGGSEMGIRIVISDRQHRAVLEHYLAHAKRVGPSRPNRRRMAARSRESGERDSCLAEDRVGWRGSPGSIVEVRFRSGRTEGSGSLQDFSLAGALVRTSRDAKRPESGSRIKLVLIPGGDLAEVELVADVVRNMKTGFAVCFVEPPERLRELLGSELEGEEPRG